ncbi:MAG: ABC transporter permease [Micrococcales bacterium]|nr:ABC transporter permease [Micrococcales bacterium]
MRAAIVAEYRKLVTTRTWWVLLLVAFGYLAFLGAVLAWALAQPNATTDAGGDGSQSITLTATQIVSSIYTIGVSLGFAFPVIVGVLVVTTEYRHKTLTPTLLAEPSRTRMIAAKLVIGAGEGVLFGLATTCAATAAGAAVLALLHQPTALGVGATWGMLGRSVLALAVWAVIGVAIGTVITNQVAAIVVVLAFTQFLEPALRTVFAVTSWGAGVGKFLPGAAGEAIAGGSFYSAAGIGQILGQWWQGLLVLLAYAAVLVVAGRLTTLRRDVA